MRGRTRLDALRGERATLDGVTINPEEIAALLAGSFDQVWAQMLCAHAIQFPRSRHAENEHIGLSRHGERARISYKMTTPRRVTPQADLALVGLTAPVA